MFAVPDRFRFLNWRPARVLTLALVAHIVLVNAFSRKETPPPPPPLREFPASLDDWRMVHEGTVVREVQDVLRADETLTRTYFGRDGRAASLFVAFFRSQRAGVNPHSPKNCLPGSGWLPLESGIVSIPLPGRSVPLQANRYLIAKGDSKSAVLYWYQTRDRTIASEYVARFYLVLDAIRSNRTDTSLIRISVPVVGENVDGAFDAAVAFAQIAFEPLCLILPS
ncbi:MAG: EpsI family protein [Bryobacteraceae bacterium]|nr:EpsI family protein [Bryobacteraceae bacterium]